MTDYEVLLDAWVKRAIRYYGESDTQLKKYCILAGPVVGNYQNGATQSIATGIKRSVSTVENHAHAFWLYRELRATAFRIRVRTLWRSLPASHWWQAWTIHKAGYDALHYLSNAGYNGWSGRDMLEEYKRDLEAGNAPMIFTRGIRALYGIVNELLLKHKAMIYMTQKHPKPPFSLVFSSVSFSACASFALELSQWF